MRKICILLSILLLLTGCKTAENNQDKPTLVSEPYPTETPHDSEKNISKQPQLSIPPADEIQTINLLIPYTTAEHIMTKENEIGWETYVLEKFGCQIDLMYYDYNNPETGFNKAENDGIIYFPISEIYTRLASEKRILMLDEYIDGYSLADDEYNKAIEKMKDLDGNIYGIPSFYYEGLVYKKYYLELLEQVKKGVPTDLNEYEQLGEALKEIDTYLMVLHDEPYFVHYAFCDVFAAHGCYVSLDYSGQIAFDPITSEYQLPVLNPNYEQAVRYIQNLIEKGYVYMKKSLTEDNSLMSITYSGIPSTVFNNGSSPFDIGFYLKGSNTQKLIFTNSNFGGFAILNDSKNVNEKISFLLEKLYQDEKLRFALTNGYEGYNYTLKEETAYIRLLNEDGTYRSRPGINFSLFENKIKTVIEDIDNNNTPVYIPALIEARTAEIKDNYPKEMFYDTNPVMGEVIGEKYMDDLLSYFREFYNNVFKLNTDVSEAIKRYKAQVEASGVLNYLDEVNSKLQNR